tara:strand:- start:8027 stop:8767 length:741 start_codon:yes stop_codon:yes gene_type:complete
MKVKLVQYFDNPNPEDLDNQPRQLHFANVAERRKNNIPKNNCGIDEVITYNKESLKKNNFYGRNKEILKMPRGAGMWLWKPFIVLDALQQSDPDDIIFYYDCNHNDFSKTNISVLVDYVKKQGNLFHETRWGAERLWTKRDLFVTMDCNHEKYFDSEQVQATWFFLKNNEQNISFVKEWLHNCCIKQNICGGSTEIYSKFKEHRSHREDQSILSLLCKKRNCNIFTGHPDTNKNKNVQAFINNFNP